MSKYDLHVAASCSGSHRCSYSGEDISLVLTITNKGSVRVGLPLGYLSRTGPVIRIMDNRSREEAFLRRNLADWSLKSELTWIAPGQSVTFDWVITGSEIEQFSTRPIDLTADISLVTDIVVDGGIRPFEGDTQLRITQY